MSAPRNLYPDTTLFVTVQAIHNSFRMVPSKLVNEIIEYAFAYVSSKYRKTWAMEFYEYEFLSTHYHLVLYDRFGRVSDFLKEFNSIVARELNAVRGASGAFFSREPGIQTVLGEERVLKHCVYTLANAVAAGIVETTGQWKGVNSFKMEYGKGRVVKRPEKGLWSGLGRLFRRRRAVRSGRAAFSGRTKMPPTALLMLDRPRCMPELSSEDLRAKVLADLEAEEARLAKKRGGKPVLGMKAARQIHWSTVPRKGKPLFGLNPTFSAVNDAQRSRMKRLRREFLVEHEEALQAHNAGRRDVVFPAGTVRMRLRHKVLTEPVPLNLLLAS